jgi:hypothetical protein
MDNKQREKLLALVKKIAPQLPHNYAVEVRERVRAHRREKGLRGKLPSVGYIRCVKKGDFINMDVILALKEVAAEHAAKLEEATKDIVLDPPNLMRP